jgi:enterochelin esterase-like enzyme
MLRFNRSFVILVLAALLAGCVSPAAAPPVPPTTTPVPPTATPNSPAATPISPAAAEASPTPATAGKIELKRGEITSKALANNLLKDPATRNFYILLPPNYNSSDKRYPVVYVLHWYMGYYGTMVGYVQDPYETALSKGDVQEMIFVFPDASNKLGGSQYLSSPTIGDYETYITQELVELVDATYRTIPDRNSRGVTGCSMGGDGSIYLAMKYPGVFGVAVPASATYDWARDPVLWKEGPEPLLKHPPKELSDFWTVPWQAQALLSVAAAAAANPAKPPFYLDMPVALVDGKAKIVPEVFDRIVAADPTHQVDRYLSQPERLRAILLFHGDRDPLVPVELARSFDKLLSNQGIEHQYAEVSGGHCDFDFGPIVQFMSDHLAGATP